MKQLDGVARGHVGQTIDTAGYAVLESCIRQALAVEVTRVRRKSVDVRDADYARGFADACEWVLKLPETILNGNSSGA